MAIEDPTDRLAPGALVHLNGRSERMLAELYRKVREFQHNLVQAPKTLKDVRVLLYWTAVMLDAPLCQGEVKARATTAFSQAKAYYDTARRQLMEGRSVDAMRRMHEALRRISAAAAEIAKSCGEGQIDIAVTPPHLPVLPEDKAAIEGAQPPLVTAMAVNPSVLLMAGSRRRKPAPRPASALEQPRPASTHRIEAEDDRYVWLVRFEVRKFYMDTGFEFDPWSLLRNALPWADEHEIAGEVLEALPYNRETGRYAWIARMAVSSFQVDTGFELDPRGLLQDALPRARGRDIAGEVLDSREPLNKDDEDDEGEA
ncbi:hypothetical protein SAMN02745121_07008 [Nannocystis exedens]|uniref:Uncharacterized protein n=1 Tax=Nannocystis exedens TaxID=54 RepID=A0A1I2G3H9_9BACT|nr:hypothetical protein [Nannocystis exedens]SFF11316.1 hypothetical protein SAMN02745121_07008 [Nannocystis exedens]